MKRVPEVPNKKTLLDELKHIIYQEVCFWEKDQMTLFPKTVHVVLKLHGLFQN